MSYNNQYHKLTVNINVEAELVSSWKSVSQVPQHGGKVDCLEVISCIFKKDPPTHILSKFLPEVGHRVDDPLYSASQ